MTVDLAPAPEPRVALATDADIHVFAIPRPFQTARIERRMPAGRTIAEILAELAVPQGRLAHVEIDGHPIPRAWWPHVRPKPGRTVTVRVVPMDSGNGDKNKTLRTVLMIVVILIAAVASWYIGGALGPIVGAAIVGVGGLALNLLLPPRFAKPKSPLAPDQTFGITGARNVANKLGPVATVYGRHRLFPFLGAEPFTEIVGNDQYLRMLFDVGYGPLAISDIRIGETPITNFAGVEMEIREGWSTDAPLTLYVGDHTEDGLSVKLDNQTYATRVTREAADEISVDVTFPEGVWSRNSKGQISSASAGVTIEYRKVGDTGAWTPVDGVVTEEVLALFDTEGNFLGYGTQVTVQQGIIVEAATQTPLRRGTKWTVPERAQYEVRLIRQDPEMTEEGSDVVFWTALRTFRTVDPIRRSGRAKIALRIKATDQLNGVIDTLSCIAHSYLPDWDPTSGQWVTRLTQNPASIYRAILQGPANARPLDGTRLDFNALQAWHGECAAAGRTYSAVLDARTTIFELLQDVAAVGRAAFGMGDGKVSVVRDIPQTVPVQHFTPRNSWGYTGHRAFPDVPHALKIRFINPAADWQPDERIVYDDGYDATNATRFETMEFLGITDPDQAWKMGRYFLAQARLRPERHELMVDFEHLICQRGDLVKVTHDVPQFGLGAGRVKAVQTDGGGNATGVTVDEQLTMVSGKSYALRFRRSDGVSVVQQITTAPGDQTTVTFTQAIPSASKPAAGDLFLFGELGKESVDLVVKMIEPRSDLSARLTLLPAAPAVHLADQGPIPPWDPQITLAPVSQRVPPTPIISSVQSDENVLVRAADGALDSRILISLHFASGAGQVPAAYIETRFRPGGSTGNWSQLRSTVAGDAFQVSVTPVEDGITYELRLRSVGRLGEVSDWVELRHTVVGKTTPPPNVVVLVLEGNLLRWAYPSPPLDLAGFKVRRHFGQRFTWDDAQEIHQGILTDNAFPISLEPTGITSYLVKAIDVGGNLSAVPAVLIVNLGDPLIENLLFTKDFKADGFPGTITNGAVVATVLEASAGAPFWSGDDRRLFWTQPV